MILIILVKMENKMKTNQFMIVLGSTLFLLSCADGTTPLEATNQALGKINMGIDATNKAIDAGEAVGKAADSVDGKAVGKSIVENSEAAKQVNATKDKVDETADNAKSLADRLSNFLK